MTNEPTTTTAIILRYTKDANGQPFRINLLELVQVPGAAYPILGRSVTWPIHDQRDRAACITESNDLTQAWAGRAHVGITYQRCKL